MTNPSSPSPEAQAIAAGTPLIWTNTFKHPRHGDLTFTAGLPLAPVLLQHSVEMDNLLANLQGPPRAATMILVAAMAGLTPVDEDTPGQGLIVQLPVVDEKRVEEDSGKVTIERTYYDPTTETDVGFLSDVWLDYSAWRSGLLTQLDAVKGPSGETSGGDSSELSNAPSVSPSTTLD